jgi:tight adherence protein C
VSPEVPAFALVACVALAATGLRLALDPGAGARLAEGGEQAQAAKPSLRPSLVARLYDSLSVRLAGRVMRFLGERRLERVRQRLDAAGRPGGLTVEGYAGRKGTFMVLVGGAGLMLLLQGHPFIFLTLAILSWFWIDIWLAGVARRRQAGIDRDLPDFLDILAVTVGAGLGFRPGLARVSEALGGPLCEEVTTALRQMELGVARRNALENLRRRNESESLARLVTSLLQAEELGAPLSSALAEMAQEMRRSTAQHSRRQAARAAPRVSLIVTTFIVPGAIVLIVATLLVGSNFNLGTFLG